MEEKNTRRTPAENRRPLQNLCLCALLIGVVLLFALLGLCLKDRTFSESENRSLAQFPQFSFAALADGSFFSDLSGYVADQFPARDTWMSVNLALNKTLGAKESSGVYLGKDNYLMQVPTAPNEEQLARNLYAMNCFAEAYPDLNTVAVIVPNAVTVLADKLPKNAPVRDQAADLAHIGGELTKVDMVDVTEALTAHAAEPLFYRTDHHWTSLAAAYAFEAIAPALDIKAPALETYTRYPVSTTFEGTLSSKAGSHKVTDTVEIFVPDTKIEYYVTYDGKQEENICSMYKREALDVKDHYTVFFGGNYSRVDITTTADTERALLLIKDSYANCMVQFLYPYFDHITIIDPRYYYDNMDSVISGESITDVLYLYNLDTFLSDTTLADAIAVGE